MFERFTDRAIKVMALSNQEAQRKNHEYIGTEHILAGLVKEGNGVGAFVLQKLGVDLKKIREELDRLVKSGPDTVTMGSLPQTPRTKKVIEFAVEEARAFNHNYVGTEHLLLGLIDEEEGIAAQMLMNLGLKKAIIRSMILDVLGDTIPTNSSGIIRACYVCKKWGADCDFSEIIKDMKLCASDQFHAPVKLRIAIYELMASQCKTYEGALHA